MASSPRTRGCIVSQTIIDLSGQRNAGPDDLQVVRTPLLYSRVQGVAPPGDDYRGIAAHLYALMLRNIATDGFVFRDPLSGVLSRPGAVLASPSYPSVLGAVDQDYVYNWTRDAAITMLEVAAVPVPGGQNQTLCDYVAFASSCQKASGAPLHRGAYLIDATPRAWSDQSDGPALRVLAVLAAMPTLDADTASLAQQVISTDVGFLLDHYREPTTNLWEEHTGQSFFARAVQLRCFQALRSSSWSGPRTIELPDAITWLTSALDQHWDGTIYRSMLDSDAPADGYDPNIDILCAALYGAVPVTDERLLATVAALFGQWADQTSPAFYPINGADAARQLGPLLGRYPADHYDGDTADPDTMGRHPWVLCTCNGAELHYRVAAAIAASGTVPMTDLSAPYFARVGVSAETPAAQAISLLLAAGDRMLDAVVHHSDHLELSEQLDGATGYEKSVRDLTWSYAAFLSAVRARGVLPADPGPGPAPATAAQPRARARRRKT